MQALKTYLLAASLLCLTPQLAVADDYVDDTIAEEMGYADEVLSTDSEVLEETDSDLFTEDELDDSPAAVEAEIATGAEATHDHSQMLMDETEVTESGFTGNSIASEILIRPVAVLGSAAGFAFFVIASPVAALASIPEPHDAWDTTWNDLVVVPFDFAFRRPLGDYAAELNQGDNI
ncbi:MAG: hypothetical protein GQ583_10520 [Methyloprofundus sp.]|nr:hypothetical protein [Methyloprofundus sp.]